MFPLACKSVISPKLTSGAGFPFSSNTDLVRTMVFLLNTLPVGEVGAVFVFFL